VPLNGPRGSAGAGKRASRGESEVARAPKNCPPGTPLTAAVIESKIFCMRATVTIRDELFGEADAMAERLGISRSRLYQAALERYLTELRDRALTEQMNEHLRVHGAHRSGLERYVAQAWAQDMGDDEW
jgi:predicted DNA-binding protein